MVQLGCGLMWYGSSLVHVQFMFNFGTLLVKVSMSRASIVELWFNVVHCGLSLVVCVFNIYFELEV